MLQSLENRLHTEITEKFCTPHFHNNHNNSNNDGSNNAPSGINDNSGAFIRLSTRRYCLAAFPSFFSSSLLSLPLKFLLTPRFLSSPKDAVLLLPELKTHLVRELEHIHPGDNNADVIAWYKAVMRTMRVQTGIERD